MRTTIYLPASHGRSCVCRARAGTRMRPRCQLSRNSSSSSSSLPPPPDAALPLRLPRILPHSCFFSACVRACFSCPPVRILLPASAYSPARFCAGQSPLRAPAWPCSPVPRLFGLASGVACVGLRLGFSEPLPACRNAETILGSAVVQNIAFPSEIHTHPLSIVAGKSKKERNYNKKERGRKSKKNKPQTPA